MTELLTAPAELVKGAEAPTPAGNNAVVMPVMFPTDGKIDPIRNRGQKVGRNDPCPCGSGKKYKNCHMREQGNS